MRERENNWIMLVKLYLLFYNLSGYCLPCLHCEFILLSLDLGGMMVVITCAWYSEQSTVRTCVGRTYINIVYFVVGCYFVCVCVFVFICSCVFFFVV